MVGVAHLSWRVHSVRCGVVWCGVARQRSIRNSIFYLLRHAFGLVVPAVSIWMLHMVASRCVARHIHLIGCVTCQRALPV